MNLKKIIAAAMVGALSITAAPIFMPGAPSAVISQAEAARGGARIAPKAAPPTPAPAAEDEAYEVYEPTPDEEAEMFGDDELPPDENT